jgi:hypothetical protein
MMTHELLLCPQCKCPVIAPSGAATGVTCQRCNSWVELDPRCTGGCLSCHKMASAQDGNSCATSAPDASPAQTVKTGLKRLFKAVFTVR